MGSKGGEVIDIDRGFEELKKTFESLQRSGSYVKVGVIGEAAAEAHPTDDRHTLTNVELALVQEYGAPSIDIPARSFIGSTFEAFKAEYVKALAKGLEKVYENELTVTRLLGLVGQKMVRDVKARVLGSNDFAPNAPATIEKKGSDRPLIDTARMIGSVSSEVVTGEG